MGACASGVERDGAAGVGRQPAKDKAEKPTGEVPPPIYHDPAPAYDEPSAPPPYHDPPPPMDD